MQSDGRQPGRNVYSLCHCRQETSINTTSEVRVREYCALSGSNTLKTIISSQSTRKYPLHEATPPPRFNMRPPVSGDRCRILRSEDRLPRLAGVA